MIKFPFTPMTTKVWFMSQSDIGVLPVTARFQPRQTHSVVQVEVFWVVTQCSVAVGYHQFGRSYCFHLQGEVMMEAARLASHRNTTRHHNPADLDLNLHRRESPKTRVYSTSFQSP
jgi:hypothetical protein